MTDPHAITTLEELEALYGPVNPNSLAKETDHLTEAYRRWIEAAPFFALATAGEMAKGALPPASILASMMPNSPPVSNPPCTSN
ncbi:MAG: hypothetical protein EP348_02520 [Alphaproteobacteria bacterium]|nr:MAG: hypothetical protein EP348_02520 [Alphaproteobacteria bacterium]